MRVTVGEATLGTLYSFTFSQTFTTGWNTIPILGGATAANAFDGTLINTDRTINGLEWPDNDINVIITITQTAGPPLSLLFNFEVNIYNPEFYLYGYSKYTSTATNSLAYSNSYYAGTNFAPSAGHSNIYSFLNFNNLSSNIQPPASQNGDSLVCSFIPINTPRTQQMVLNYAASQTVPSPLPSTNTAVIQLVHTPT
jgi:hypothetical protein